MTATAETAPKPNDGRPGPGRPKGSGATADTYALLAKAKAKRETYRAQMSELDYKQRAGELVNAEEVRQLWAGHINIAKTALLGLPSKLAHELAAVSDPAKIAEIVRARIVEVLTDLAGDHGRPG
jgi:hypothetical protein